MSLPIYAIDKDLKQLTGYYLDNIEDYILVEAV